MRVLITGLTGFAGAYLAEELGKHPSVSLSGTNRSGRWPAALAHLSSHVRLHRLELNDATAAEALLRSERPDHIYHLAGYANAGRSVQEADAAWTTNLAGTRCLYEAILRWDGHPRVLFVGSGLVYGHPQSPDHAHDEECSFRPTNPYAASKAAADLASYQYTQTSKLDIVTARPFNHLGPRQSPDYAISHFAHQIAEMERGRRPAILETGNLHAVRDFTDVRDVVCAYVRLLAHGTRAESYNVASGVTRKIVDAVDWLCHAAKLKVSVRQRPDLLRAVDPAGVPGNADKLMVKTGWKPAIPFTQSLADTLEYWRLAL